MKTIINVISAIVTMFVSISGIALSINFIQPESLNTFLGIQLIVGMIIVVAGVVIGAIVRTILADLVWYLTPGEYTRQRKGRY